MEGQFPLAGWIAFAGLVLGLLAVDLLVHRGTRGTSRRSAIGWSAAWVLLGLAFCGFVWGLYGGEAAQEYLGAYLIEKSLSLDNLFVFLVIFQSLGIPETQQHRVLFWGIFGALLSRALFIFVGVEALHHWHAIVYVFGALLLFTAWRVARDNPAEQKESRVVVWLARHLPLSARVEGHSFLTRLDGRRVATPLLLALLAIEVSDIAFAVDSVPAALAVSQKPFIVYSSNVFAILGLRALYIALAHILSELRYLHYGLSAVLAFAGLKMLVPPAWVHIPPLVSVAVIAVCIGVAVWASLRARRASERKHPPGPPPREVHA